MTVYENLKFFYYQNVSLYASSLVKRFGRFKFCDYSDGRLSFVVAVQQGKKCVADTLVNSFSLRKTETVCLD